jgi:predicted ATP-dependent endonuclease of OLD family
MHIESLTFNNFRCFGSDSTSIKLNPELVVFIGDNGSGKTAAMIGLLKLFGVAQAQRQVRFEDFHIPADGAATPESRTLSIEAIIAFPELEADGEALDSVPEFFSQMSTDDEGSLKCRIRLEASWTNDGSADGSISEDRYVVQSLEADFAESDRKFLTASDRSRIQAIYIPSHRDGASHVQAFLNGRLWRAARWSEELRQMVAEASENLTQQFRAEPPVAHLGAALARRWQELYRASTDGEPSFQAIDRDFLQFVAKTQLQFEPTDIGRPKLATQLSDGQLSLLHIALTNTILDIEDQIVDGQLQTEFDRDLTQIPSLTILAIEEPENGLSPFYLSRIVNQILSISSARRAQALIASHSSSVVGRVDPEAVRYFRIQESSSTASVKSICLPDGSETLKYVREAVRAHPDIYFARFVVLGEGASEEVVIPALAAARGINIDPSFVAVVPLGGRHVHHFWRLLNDLDIPYATLLDLDLGRSGGGISRIKTVCKELAELGRDPFLGMTGYGDLEDLNSMSRDDLDLWINHLEEFKVYFNAPLDLDMSMLVAYFSSYATLSDGAIGPSSTDATDAVLGVVGDSSEYTEMGEELRWYRYLFLGRSKPDTHFHALSRSSNETLASGMPASLWGLIESVKSAVG